MYLYRCIHAYIHVYAYIIFVYTCAHVCVSIYACMHDEWWCGWGLLQLEDGAVNTHRTCSLAQSNVAASSPTNRSTPSLEAGCDLMRRSTGFGAFSFCIRSEAVAGGRFRIDRCVPATSVSRRGRSVIPPVNASAPYKHAHPTHSASLFPIFSILMYSCSLEQWGVGLIFWFFCWERAVREFLRLSRKKPTTGGLTTHRGGVPWSELLIRLNRFLKIEKIEIDLIDLNRFKSI